MILSMQSAKPKIKAIRTIPMKPAPPSINFSLRTWWNPAFASSGASSTATGVGISVVVSAAKESVVEESVVNESAVISVFVVASF